MKKTLLVTEPCINSYPYHGNLLSILQANNYNLTLPWILENFTNLYIPDFPEDIKMDFYVGLYWKNCPFVLYQRLERKLLKKRWSIISEFIIDSIDEQNYVYFLANHFYLTPSSNYQKQNFIHDLFIWGYDREKRIFYVSDNFVNGKYSSHEVTFDEVNMAYSSVEDSDDWMSGVEIVKFRDNKIYWFDSLLIKEKLKKYIDSSNLSLENRFPGEYWKSGYFYGRSIYHRLNEYFSLVYNGKVKTKDIRPFHVLLEHKNNIKALIDYMVANGHLENSDIYNMADEIIQYSLLLRNLYLKYTMTDDLEFILRMKSLLIDIEEKEFTLLNNVINNIKTVNFEQNILNSAELNTTSICLSEHRNIDKIRDPDMNSVYRSSDSPSFPVTITIELKSETLMNEMEIISRFGMSIGVTCFLVEGFIDCSWIKLTDIIRYEYIYNDYTLEVIKSRFNKIYSLKKLRLLILDANVNWNRFEINWVGLYNTP